MRFIIQLFFFLLMGLLTHNYFLGNEKERESSAIIFKKMGEVAVAITKVFKEEQKKIEKGDYDSFFEQMDDFFQKIKANESEFGDADLGNFEDLEWRFLKLKNLMYKMNREGRQGRYQNQKAIQIKLNDDLNRFMDDVKAVRLSVRN